MSSRLTCAAASVLGCAVLGILSACGSSDRPGPGPTTDDSGFTETFTDPPTEDTDNPVDPPVTRTTIGIKIASPTLDGPPPVGGPPQYSVEDGQVEDTGCEVAVNGEAGVAITVVSVGIVAEPGESSFALGNHANCGRTTVTAGCRGVTLDVRERCAVEVRFTPPAPTVSDGAVRHTAVLRWNLRAQCVAREGPVCGRLPEGDAPSAADPIVVEWSEDRRLVGSDERAPDTPPETATTTSEAVG